MLNLLVLAEADESFFEDHYDAGYGLWCCYDPDVSYDAIVIDSKPTNSYQNQILSYFADSFAEIWLLEDVEA